MKIRGLLVRVESERIELSSKQAIKKRSTCLVFV